MHGEGKFYLTALTDRNWTRLDLRRAASMNMTSRHISLAVVGIGGVPTRVDLAVPQRQIRTR